MARPLELQLATDPAFWKPYMIVEVRIDLKENKFFVKYRDHKEEEIPIPTECADRLAEGNLKDGGGLIDIVNRYVFPELSLPSSLEEYNVQDLRDKIAALKEKADALGDQRQELKVKRESIKKEVEASSVNPIPYLQLKWVELRLEKVTEECQQVVGELGSLFQELAENDEANLQSKNEAASLRDERIFKSAESIMEKVNRSKTPPTLKTWTKILREKMGELSGSNPVKDLIQKEIDRIDELEVYYEPGTEEYEHFVGQLYSRLNGWVNLDEAKDRYFLG